MHLNESPRIAVTGIGLCTPLGSDRESSWRGIVAGRSATRWLEPPHWTEKSRVAGGPVCWPERRPFQHPEPLVELALTTATEAMADARLDAIQLAQNTVGVVFGTSKGGLHTFGRQFEQFRNQSDRTGTEVTANESPDWLDVFPSRAAAAIGSLIGGYGPVLCPVMACATGLAACLRGAELIQSGDCDVVLAGSADASLQPALISSFRRLGVLSREENNPAQACRPFDRMRSGFVIGEGAACLVLERLDAAIARGANCYAEWLGGRTLSDGYSLTQLDPSGTALQQLLRDILAINSRRPDYINLHGTGTATNDMIESRALYAIFGSGCTKIESASLKGGMGHLLGAAGSVELAATALSIRDQMVPPTANFVEPDQECRLKLTSVAAHRQIDVAWKISMGFGGHIAGACLGRIGGPG